MQVRPGGGHRVDRAAHHDEVVRQRGQPRGLLSGNFRSHPGPRGKLVAAQPQPEYPTAADRAARRAQHPLGEQQPVLTVVVPALVGQTGVELTQQ
jgi:hypothetical protein